MKFLKTNCFRCNALQSFKPRYRTVNGYYETYIFCKTCRSEFVLDRIMENERNYYRERNRNIRRAS